MPEPAMYDAARGGAIWNERMSSTDGDAVAAWAIVALREAKTETHPPGWSWQSRALELAFPADDSDGSDAMWFAVALNVLIEIRKDFHAQVAEAKARGEFVPNAKDAT